MDSGLWWLLAALAVAVVGGLAVAVGAHRARGRLMRELAVSRQEIDALEQRLDSLVRQVAPTPVAPQEFLITSAGVPDLAGTASREISHAPSPQSLPPGAFASVALGESLVTLVSLGHGLRRALSPENRNRIAFEMRREVRRARKQRKRDLKEAKRHLRASSLHQDAA